MFTEQFSITSSTHHFDDVAADALIHVQLAGPVVVKNILEGLGMSVEEVLVILRVIRLVCLLQVREQR